MVQIGGRMRESPPTIIDVARLAKVHPSTASRVLRGVSSQSVSAETRDRIFDAAKILEYRANSFARGLRLQRTNAIALLSPYLESLGFNEIARGVMDRAAELGYMVVTVVAKSSANQELYSKLMLEKRVDGLLVAFGMINDPILAKFSNDGFPLVTLNRRVNGVKGSVVVEDEFAARIAVEHLVSLGHKRIGHISGQPGTDTSARRESGFRAACADLGVIVPKRGVVPGNFSLEGGRVAAKQILALPKNLRPTGIVAADPLSALAASKYFKEAGMVLPSEMSVVALNDDMILNYVEPGLTAVRLGYYEMGRVAVQTLIGVVAGETPKPYVVREPAPTLTVRGSTVFPRTDVSI
jgi:LacI family transcriptional regulator